MKLSSFSLDTLGVMICGDVGSFPYRSGSELTEFFVNLSLPFVHDGSTRRKWVQWVLKELNEKEPIDESLPSEQLVKVIEELVHPRHYRENSFSYFKKKEVSQEKAIAGLNEVLKDEGLEVFIADEKGTCKLRNVQTGSMLKQKSLAYPSPLFFGIALKFSPGFKLSSEGGYELLTASNNRAIKGISLHPSFTFEQFMEWWNNEYKTCPCDKYGCIFHVIGEHFKDSPIPENVWISCLIVKGLLKLMDQNSYEKNFFLAYLRLATFKWPQDERKDFWHTIPPSFPYPVLIPQAWLELPPRDGYITKEIKNQRVDFTFFWRSTNCIVELDGIQHYASRIGSEWIANEENYAANLHFERYLRWKGWKVFRFSNVELKDNKRLEKTVDDFISHDLYGK